MKKKAALLMAGVLAMSTLYSSSFVSLAEDVQDQQNVEVLEESEMQDDTDLSVDSQTSVSEEESESEASTESLEGSQPVESEDEPQLMNNANSWRYQNGENISIYETARERTAISSNAWKKVNGSYVNSQGTVIPGATKKGMDIGYSQGRIDWEKVKKSDIDFVIIECGYGNNSVSQDDKWWSYNVSECERLGIPYGVYLYSYAKDTSMASSEADHVLRLLQGHKPSYPVYLDMEDNSTIAAGNAMLGNIAQIFCDKVANAGYKPGIYANLNWWSNYLTSSVFANTNWSKWVAQYNITCDYEGSYDIWQCTSVGKVDGVSGNVDLNFWMNGNNTVVPSENVEKVSVSDSKVISLTSHQQTYGWHEAAANGVQSGITGHSKRLEAFKINIPSEYGDLGIQYRAHVSSIGWQDWVSTGNIAGTTGQSKAIQAVEIKLTGNNASKYDVYYRVHAQTYGWMGWAKNGEPAGSAWCSKRIEAIQVAVLPKDSAAPGSTDNAYKKGRNVEYKVHQQTYGWLSKVVDGAEAGVTGRSKRMEAITLSLSAPEYDGEIKYRIHQQTYGWHSWVTDGAQAGITGQSKRMEAIEIALTGTMASRYDVYYRAHVQTYGWLDWAKNGEMAGTSGLSKRMEAIQVVLVPKGGNAPGSTSRPSVKK